MRKGGYTLTLKNEGSTPHTFQIYQIFSGDLDESKTLSNIQWGTGIKEASNQIKIVLPDDVETLEIEKGKDYVTLITCTPYGVNSHRLLVRGERTVYKQSESKIEDMIKKNNLKYIMLTAGVILALIGMTVLVSVFLIKRRKRRKLNEK